MTENQAIERMKYRIKTATDAMGKGVDGKAYEDMEMAIVALEEIQRYRLIGTVDTCREAMEKQKPKKPKKIAPCKSVNYYKCSLCGELLAINKPFCDGCGNAVDWGIEK